MKKSIDSTPQNDDSTSSCKFQKQVDSAIQSACEKYQKHRNHAVKEITQGSRITDHHIKL